MLSWLQIRLCAILVQSAEVLASPELLAAPWVFQNCFSLFTVPIFEASRFNKKCVFYLIIKWMIISIFKYRDVVRFQFILYSNQVHSYLCYFFEKMFRYALTYQPAFHYNFSVHFAWTLSPLCQHLLEPLNNMSCLIILLAHQIDTIYNKILGGSEINIKI